MKLLLLQPGKKEPIQSLCCSNLYILGRKRNLISRLFGDNNEHKESSAFHLEFDPPLGSEAGKIFFDRGHWRLEALKEKVLSVNKKNLPPKEAHKINFFDTISMGPRQTLLILPPEGKAIFHGTFCFVLGIGSVLNYSLLYNGISFIQFIRIYNTGTSKSLPVSGEFSLGEYYTHPFEIPPVKAGDYFDLSRIPFYPELFKQQSEISSFHFRINLEKNQIFEKEIRILSFNTWLKSGTPNTIVSLASFVLPLHTHVIQITSRVKTSSTKPKEIGLLESLYDYFTRKWNLTFSREEKALSGEYQKIRLPHQVLYDWDGRKGEGNCLDLSLLLASCLEKLKLHPILALIEISPGLRHALVGVALPGWAPFKPVLKEKTDLRGLVVFIDPNGLSEGLNFEEARQRGELLFQSRKLLFTLDISASRSCNIQPLPFKGTPKESPVVTRLDIKAKELTDTRGGDFKLCTTLHMLTALLLHGTGFTAAVFEKNGISCPEGAEKILKGLQNVQYPRKVPRVTLSGNYRKIFPGALILAGRGGDFFITEEHILLSILEIPTGSLDQALTDLGVSRKQLKKTALSLLNKAEELPVGTDDLQSQYNNKGKDFFVF